MRDEMQMRAKLQKKMRGATGPYLFLEQENFTGGYEDAIKKLKKCKEKT